jgi:hypothetical protein
LDDTLLSTVVTDGLARGVDRPTQDVVRCCNSRPKGFQDFFFGYDTVASSDQIEKQVEHLGLDFEIRLVPAQHVEPRIEFKSTEPIYSSREFGISVLGHTKLRSTITSGARRICLIIY